VQHERKPVSDRIESIHNISTSPDNNNIPTFQYGNNAFIKNEIPFIKTEMPYVGHRSIYNDQTPLHLMPSSSKIFSIIYNFFHIHFDFILIS